MASDIGSQHTAEREEAKEGGGYITSLLVVTIQGGWLMERDASIEAFGFSRGVIGSTRRPTIVKKLVVIVLQHIMTPSFASLDIFALFVPYLFAV